MNKKKGTQHIPDHNDQWDQSLRTQHQNHPGLSRTRIPVASSVSQRKKERKKESFLLNLYVFTDESKLKRKVLLLLEKRQK
jgi:hypothetical protein